MKRSDFSHYDYLSNASQSGKFIYLIMESFPQGILITNEKEEIIYANHAMATLCGYTRREMLGKIMRLFLHLPDQQQRLKELATLRSEGVYEGYDLYIRRKNATLFLAHTLTAPYNDEEGQVMGTIHIITDITALKREAELEALAIGATKALNSVVILDRFGKIEWVNEGFTRLSGFRLFEVIDTKGEVLRSAEDQQMYLSKLEETVSTKKPVAFEYLHKNKSGRQYRLKSSFTPLLDAEGDVKEVMLIETEIECFDKPSLGGHEF